LPTELVREIEVVSTEDTSKGRWTFTTSKPLLPDGMIAPTGDHLCAALANDEMLSSNGS
jgi:hypothetical protein